MLTNLFQKFKKNIVNRESIQELSRLCHEIKTVIDNCEAVFNYSKNNPDKKLPIKNSKSYKTHNYYITTTSTEIYKKVLFIINADVLFNNISEYYTDISIFIDGINVDAGKKNFNENFSTAYRITACSFSVKSKKSKCKLQLMKNKYMIGAISIKNDIVKYYDEENKMQMAQYNINLNDMINKDRIIFDKPRKEYMKIGEIPEESYYFIMECEDCEMYQFYKHIEHIPKMEYQQILNCNININAWD